MQPNGRVGQKLKPVSISRHEISTSPSQTKGEKAPWRYKSTETQIAAHEASKPQPVERAWQVPTVMARSCSCSFPSAAGLLIRIGNTLLRQMDLGLTSYDHS